LGHHEKKQEKNVASVAAKKDSSSDRARKKYSRSLEIEEGSMDRPSLCGKRGEGKRFKRNRAALIDEDKG